MHCHDRSRKDSLEQIGAYPLISALKAKEFLKPISGQGVRLTARGESACTEHWMARKWLFWGLTLVLVAVLVVLIVQGHRLERQKASQLGEVIQNSVPTATRAFSPKDIQVLQSNMKLEESAGKSGKFKIALHEIELHNSGSVPYEKIELRFAYVDRSGKVLASRTHSVTQTIFPDSTVRLDLRIDDVPLQTTDFRVAVSYADIGSGPKKQQSPRRQE